MTVQAQSPRVESPGELSSSVPESGPPSTHQKIDLNQEVPTEKDLEAHYHLGIAYMEMDLIDKAIEEFEAALGYGPKQIDCLVMLGHCYMEKGLHDRSIVYLEKASCFEGLTQEEYIRINQELGRVYEACGMKEKAWQAFKKSGKRESN
jgi:tetratricopeptide (TPR) repeat protein